MNDTSNNNLPGSNLICNTGMLKNLGQDKILGDFQLEDKNDEVLIFFRVSDSFDLNFKDFFDPDHLCSSNLRPVKFQTPINW